MKITFIVLPVVAMAIVLGFVSCSETNSENEVQPGIAVNEGTPITKYEVDAANSFVEWAGSLVGVYSHRGVVQVKNGSFGISEGSVVEGSFEVDMNSIEAIDGLENYKNGSKEDLIAHLESPDFFDVSEYELASLKILELMSHEKTRQPMLNSELTIKGISQPVEITNLNIHESEDGVEVEGVIKFDRHDFGVSYKNSSKDLVISDEVELHIVVKGIRK